MNPEDILKAAQNEQQDLGEYERLIARKAANTGVILGVILCLLLILLEYFLTKSFDFGKIAIIFIMHGGANFYEGIKNKNKKMIIIGVTDFIFTALWILLFVGVLLI